MAVHVFVTNQENFKICVEHGIVALPEVSQDKTFDELLSRIVTVKEDDYIFIYITSPQMELHGVWKADGNPFYEEAPVWPDRVYPFRCRIKPSEYRFDTPLKLNEITDLYNNGRLWTWTLTRTAGRKTPNAMFSLSNAEFHLLISEFLKINPFTSTVWRIQTPYPYRESNIIDYVHYDENEKPAYESSIMTLLANSFNMKKFDVLFGNYSDYLCYVPNSIGKEMDFLLIYSNPYHKEEILSYDIIELKRDKFKEEGLRQLIGYESWFLQKKVAGDQKMLRVSAIAASFSNDVIDYAKKRENIENRRIKLLKYDVTTRGEVVLTPVL